MLKAKRYSDKRGYRGGKYLVAETQSNEARIEWKNCMKNFSRYTKG